MSEVPKDHIETLLAKAADAYKSEDALRFSQAALNVANTMCARNTANMQQPGAQ